MNHVFMEFMGVCMNLWFLQGTQNNGTATAKPYNSAPLHTLHPDPPSISPSHPPKGWWLLSSKSKLNAVNSKLTWRGKTKIHGSRDVFNWQSGPDYLVGIFWHRGEVVESKKNARDVGVSFGGISWSYLDNNSVLIYIPGAMPPTSLAAGLSWRS